MSINVKKYLAKFESTSAYNTFATSNDYVTPNVSLIEENGAITGMIYNPYVAPTPHDYSQDYFTVEALESGTLNIICATGYVQYSLNDGENWSEEYGSIEDLSLNVNDKILLKGDITFNGGPSDKNQMSYTGDFNVYGNIMSLVYGDNFANQISLEDKSSIFYSFLAGNETLLSAENLILPATTLADYCYGCIFEDCTSLTAAPSLPATILASGCYDRMFKGCTSLITAPELPATSLIYECYHNMFEGCTSLTTAPELPATTLADSCYRSMFYDCTSLTDAPELPATTLGEYCYSSMFEGCTSLITAPELPAITLADSCYRNMFQGCTSLTDAPELPATTLGEYCYSSMFEGCTNLNSITCLATDISATDCTANWVYGVADTGTFTKAVSMTDWTTGYSGIPSGWTVQDYVAS